MRLMTNKFLYLVNFWPKFPTSEYGGILVVVGKDDNEVHDVLLEWRDDYLEKYDGLIMENIVKAQRFPLLENEESRVAEYFTT